MDGVEDCRSESAPSCSVFLICFSTSSGAEDLATRLQISRKRCLDCWATAGLLLVEKNDFFVVMRHFFSFLFPFFS